MLLPPNPIVQQSFKFLQKTIKQMFVLDNEQPNNTAFTKEVYINERINRPDVYDMDKKQAIACYPIYGWSFGQITIREVERYKVLNIFVSFEVIDGGHRYRSIKEFLENKFPLPAWAEPIIINGKKFEVANKFYDDLDSIVQENYLKYQVMFMNYDKSLSDYEAGIVFNWQNKQSDLNDIEKFNAIQTMVGNYIRERSRSLNDNMKNISGFSEKHKLFTSEPKPNKHFLVGTVILEEDSRLRFQYILSQIVFWYSCLNDKNNKPTSHFNADKVTSLGYTWDTIYTQLGAENNLWKTKNKIRIESIEYILNEIYKISCVFNNLSDTKMNDLLIRFIFILIHELKCKHGINNVKIESNKFGMFLHKVISELKTKTLQYKTYKGPSSNDERTDIGIKLLFAFLKMMNFQTASKCINIAADGSKTFKSTWDNIKNLKEFGITITPKTSPTKTDRNEMYVEQEQSCALDGEFCKLEDMDFAHDIARAKGIANGSQTNKDSGKLVWRKWINMMGQMTIDEFKNSNTFKESKHLAQDRIHSYNL